MAGSYFLSFAISVPSRKPQVRLQSLEMAKKRISLTAAYTTPYIRANSFTVDLSDPIIVGGGRNYAYGLLESSVQEVFEYLWLCGC